MGQHTNDVGDADTSDRYATAGPDQSRVQHDWTERRQPSVAVVETVGAVTNRAVTELPPLQKTVDSDALDRLLTDGPSSVLVSFRYAHTTVSVDGDGVVEVRDESAPTSLDAGQADDAGQSDIRDQ